MNGCHRCGAPLAPNKAPGTPRKWCSERCRKRQYDRACTECGARCDGTTPGSTRTTLCLPCASVASGAARKVWTRERIIARIQEWASLHGEPPAVRDWNPWRARRALGDEARAQRFEQADGHWPGFTTVIDEFGSWNAAIVAAGFQPRITGGGGGNTARRRSARAKAAA